MKIIVAAGICAFERDEFERLGSLLAGAIGEQGHDVEFVKLDADAARPDHLVDQAAAVRSLRVDRADMLVAIGWPSHLLSHDRKIVWLGQRSMCGGWGANASASDRDILVEQEVWALRSAERRFALSRAAASSALRICQEPFELLGLPLGQTASPTGKPIERSEVLVSMKCDRNSGNLELAFQGLALSHPRLRLAVMGSNLDEDGRKACDTLASRAGVRDRVRWVGTNPSAYGLSDIPRAVLDLSNPGVNCGLWLDQVMSPSVPAIVAEDGDAWEIAARHPESLQIVPTAELIGAALDRLSVPPANQNMQSSHHANLRLDWQDTVRVLLS